MRENGARNALALFAFVAAGVAYALLKMSEMLTAAG
jgi:hypothetical protein